MAKDVSELKRPVGLGKRHIQSAVMALASFTAYGLRIILSVAIVAMTGHEKAENNATITADQSPYPVYDWDETAQGLVLSSFFWGYFVMQIPAGILTQRYGGHLFLTGAIISTSLFTILLPPCAFLGSYWFVCLNRMAQGLTQGFIFPSIFGMMALWTPPSERSVVAGVVLSAQNLGPVVASPLAGFIAVYAGWPAIFYGFGAAGIVTGVLVFLCGADSPSNHKTICPSERAYIERSLGGKKEERTIPWCTILTNVPTLAAIATMAFWGGVYLTFLTQIPTYLSSVLKFDIKENGLMSALPYLANWIISFFFATTCDVIISRTWLSITKARKVYNSISHVGSAIFMVLLSYSTDATLSVALLTTAVALMAATCQGVQSNFMDLSPNYAGTIYSISNFFNAILGMVGPLLIAEIVTETGSVTEWRIVFFLFAAVMLLSNVLFVVFGTGKVQGYNFHRRPSRVSQGP